MAEDPITLILKRLVPGVWGYNCGVSDIRKNVFISLIYCTIGLLLQVILRCPGANFSLAIIGEKLVFAQSWRECCLGIA